jgi:hypothetical protein
MLGTLCRKSHYGTAAATAQAVGEAALCRIGGQFAVRGFFSHADLHARYLLARAVELVIRKAVVLVEDDVFARLREKQVRTSGSRHLLEAALCVSYAGVDGSRASICLRKPAHRICSLRPCSSCSAHCRRSTFISGLSYERRPGSGQFTHSHLDLCRLVAPGNCRTRQKATAIGESRFWASSFE